MEFIATVLFHTAVVSKVRLLEAIENRAAFIADTFNNEGHQANESPQDNQEDYIGTIEYDVFRIVAELVEVNVHAFICKISLVVD